MTLRKYFTGLSANTFLLALASLFGDVSSEMLYPVLPMFLTQTLGASPTIMGLVEGVAQAAQYVVQGLSGWLSDRLGRRKPVAVAGYAVAAFGQPLIGLAGSWPGVLAARTADRLDRVAGLPRETPSSPPQRMKPAGGKRSASRGIRGQPRGLPRAVDCAGPIWATSPCVRSSSSHSFPAHWRC